MTDAEHAAVLRRMNREMIVMTDERMAAVERAIELLERWHDFTELAKSMRPEVEANRVEVDAALKQLRESTR